MTKPSHLSTFYIIFSTQTLSLIGSRMSSIGIGIWVFANTGQTTPLLLTAFFNELPGMAVGSLAGVLVDRWDRRKVLLLADAGQAIGTVLLLLSFLSGMFQIWHLYAVALLQGAFAIFQQPAKDAATTMLVPEDRRERINAIQQTAFPLAGVIAPALAGGLYAAVGIAGVVVVDLATFLVAVTAVYFVHIPHPPETAEGQAAKGTWWQELSGGFRYLARYKNLLTFVLYMVFINFMLNGPLELSLPYLISVTGSEATAGWLMGLLSLGAFAGASLIAVWGGTRPRMHTILGGLLLSGVMFLFYGTLRAPGWLGMVIFVLMMPLPIMGALYTSILQLKTPPDMQGRIFATIGQLGFLGSTASFVLTGPLVDQVLEPAVGTPIWGWVTPVVGNATGAGMGLVLFLTGIIIFTVTTAIYLMPSVRCLEEILPDYELL